MPEVSEFAPGMPCWVELATPDIEASREFYRQVFGWDSYALSDESLGEYEMFTLGGVQGPEVAGMQALADDAQQPTWTCYFRTADIEDGVKAARAAGGQVLSEPTPMAHLGRIVLVADPEGAGFALWEPREFQGAALVDEPSTMCWVELACRRPDEARRFYADVFGWSCVDRFYYTPYANWKLGDWSVGGMVAMDELWTSEYPAHWIPYFWVADCDATTRRATDLGATVWVEPTDVSAGRHAFMTDPAGARLSVLTPNQSHRAETKNRSQPTR